MNDCYEEQHISPDNPHIWIPELNLGLGLRTEGFRGIVQPWHRWCDEMGNFFPTPTETANAITELAQTQAADAQAKAADAQAQLEALQRQQIQSVLKLLELGLEAKKIAEIVGVTIAEVTAIQATL